MSADHQVRRTELQVQVDAIVGRFVIGQTVSTTARR
jgi:hypothetical protein